MTTSNHGKRRNPVRFLFEYSLFLVAGAFIALVWANVEAGDEHGSYHRFVHWEPFAMFTGDSADDADHGDDAAHAKSEAHADEEADHEEGDEEEAAAAGTDHGTAGHHSINLHFLVNDILMALFFAIAAKEVVEALLPGGALSNPRQAATPIMATIGGIAGPAALYLAGAALWNESEALGRGWAVPCATDIAFSYLVARLIFGQGHPAIAFLLLLAIADDAAGLVILAVFYPTGKLALSWLWVTLASMIIGWVFQKHLRLQSFWWYLMIPGVMCWYSFFQAGIHPALGLVPIVVVMPHAHSDLGIFVREELQRHDTLNAFEHFWKNPVELILGLFGLVNAGVVVSNFGAGTWLVLLGLIVGKPLGITLFTLLGEKLFRLQIPGGMGYRHVISLGMVAGIGFTVALFVSTAAFPSPGPIQDSIKMGALCSFLSAVVAIAGARMLGVRPLKSVYRPKPEPVENAAPSFSAGEMPAS